jgi:hypothetical protein
MTDQTTNTNALAEMKPAGKDDGVALEVYGSRDEIKEFATRLKLMVSGGNKLSDNEAMALAQYSRGNGLNPFIGEAYYMPGVGPVAGIAGYRKKADEQLDLERKNARSPFSRWNITYSEPEGKEAESFGEIKPGDIVVKAAITDTLSSTNWEQRKLGAMVQFIKAGLQAKDASEAADALVGECPKWTAVGIVRASENFGGDKMSRYERACKRAEKQALKKRFPRINLPEPDYHPADDPIVDGGYDPIPDNEPATPARPAAEIVTELY